MKTLERSNTLFLGSSHWTKSCTNSSTATMFSRGANHLKHGDFITIFSFTVSKKYFYYTFTNINM